MSICMYLISFIFLLIFFSIGWHMLLKEPCCVKASCAPVFYSTTIPRALAVVVFLPRKNCIFCRIFFLMLPHLPTWVYAWTGQQDCKLYRFTHNQRSATITSFPVCRVLRRWLSRNHHELTASTFSRVEYS